MNKECNMNGIFATNINDEEVFINLDKVEMFKFHTKSTTKVIFNNGELVIHGSFEDIMEKIWEK